MQELQTGCTKVAQGCAFLIQTRFHISSTLQFTLQFRNTQFGSKACSKTMKLQSTEATWQGRGAEPQRRRGLWALGRGPSTRPPSPPTATASPCARGARAATAGRPAGPGPRCRMPLRLRGCRLARPGAPASQRAPGMAGDCGARRPDGAAGQRAQGPRAPGATL
jgi:hypothetical protein